ncbi:hypothetical protein JWH04_20600 [Xanthomonas melonis]|uniref:hypothetical protein n=1 Tax=Xanthomonas melonis TaxID=56456 RepID=UPI001E4006DE|nr:hypothetical protein [Xanthomonas melonis]MCD0281310.1 hypothetical protein [Xanthomonas melonis]
MATNKVTVKSKTERGRWRAGLHFTRAGRSLSTDDALTDEQLRAIAEDPELVVLPYEESDEERQAREAIEHAAAKKAEAERIAADKQAAEKAAAAAAGKANAAGRAAGKGTQTAGDKPTAEAKGE